MRWYVRIYISETIKESNWDCNLDSFIEYDDNDNLYIISQDLGQLLTVTSLSNLTHLTSLELNFYDGECPSCMNPAYL